MEKIRTVATGESFLTSTATDPNKWDTLYEELGDLVNDQFRAWYCKSFCQLGEGTIRKLASIARADGINPRKYFSLLIKQNLLQS